MKKMSAFFVALIFIFSLIACKNEEPKPLTRQQEIYNLALESGYTGTYEEWLESIKGKDGQEIELSVIDGKIVWHYIGSNTWKEIYSVNDLIGPKGEDGVSITKIEKTKTEGLVDTYTIYYSDGKTTEFTVTNGSDGIQGIEGKPGDDGHTPVITIGSNGNWFIDGVDTKVNAKGTDGKDGISITKIERTKTEGLVDTYTIYYSNGTTTEFTVTNGKDGTSIEGKPGDDGHTPVITIGTNGNWFVDGVDTKVSAKGEKGEPGKDGVSITKIEKTKTEGLVDTYTIYYSDGKTTEFTVTNGSDGIQGIEGKPGADGHTPVISIGSNGNWFVDDVDTKVSAKGEKGEPGKDGISITKIEKTKAEGLVDTYTIYYSDGTTSEFTVTNGKDGTSIEGKPVADGHTPKISIGSNGNWFIDGVDTEVSAKGEKGEPGADGLSAYQIYLKYHPEYKGTEEEWIDDLVNGRLATNTPQPVEIYTITFNLNGGSLDKTELKVKYMEALELPIPTKKDAEFLGWYLADKKIEITKYEFKENITLTARWKDNPAPVESYSIADSYSHVFNKGEITKDGGTTSIINGLAWNYDSATHISFDSVKGIQIGSANNPQASFSMLANFPETVKITDFSIELSVANEGNASYIIEFGNYKKEGNFTNTAPVSIEAFDLNEISSSFKLTLKATNKAMYLKSISFSVLKKNNDFNLDVDTSEPDPIIPNPKPSEGVIPEGLLKPGVGGIPQAKYQLISIEKYYENTNLTKTQEELRLELNTLVSTMTMYSYGDSRYILPYLDEDITNPGKINGIYDGALFAPSWDQGKSWNREHVWACNHMHLADNGNQYRPENSTKNHASDLHNLRVCTSSLNSTRSDMGYADGVSGFFFPNQTEGLDYRGDVARILFYMYVRYPKLSLGETVDFTSMGKLSFLITWANEDQPDDFEKRRNNRIYEFQGNRNPFIDYPNLVNQLF